MSASSKNDELGTKLIYQSPSSNLLSYEANVWEMILLPNEAATYHTHTKDYFYYIYGGATLVILDSENRETSTVLKLPLGEIFAYRVEGNILVLESDPSFTVDASHGAKNIGSTTFAEFLVEFERKKEFSNNFAEVMTSNEKNLGNKILTSEKQGYIVWDIKVSVGEATQQKDCFSPANDYLVYIMKGTTLKSEEPSGHNYQFNDREFLHVRGADIESARHGTYDDSAIKALSVFQKSKNVGDNDLWAVVVEIFN